MNWNCLFGLCLPSPKPKEDEDDNINHRKTTKVQDLNQSAEYYYQESNKKGKIEEKVAPVSEKYTPNQTHEILEKEKKIVPDCVQPTSHGLGINKKESGGNSTQHQPRPVNQNFTNEDNKTLDFVKTEDLVKEISDSSNKEEIQTEEPESKYYLFYIQKNRFNFFLRIYRFKKQERRQNFEYRTTERS